MATILDYALMAGVAYRDTRAEINRFPIPKEWHLVSRNPQDESTGFEASAFGNAETIFGCTEIVISYAGTDSDDWTGDVAADLALVAGLASEQLLQAAEYYLQIKAINPDAKITLTGHSLGGGLAALVAVFFNETAVTFDQAPFRNAASWMRAKEVLLDLWGKFPVSSYPRITEWLAPLDRFIASFDPLGLGWSQDGLSAREAKVSNTSVQGEIASISNSIRIGTEEPSLQHGDYPHPIDLHTQSLLTAFLQSDATAEDGKALNDVTFKLIDLLKMIFDENLYAVDDLKKAKENFLERLVKHEAGITGSLPADAMLTRFTRDLWKLAQDGGLTLRDGNPTNADLNEVSKALTAFAMQKYYEETADSTGAGEKLFDDTGLTGGIRFDLAAVSSKIDTALKAGDRIKLADAKGFDLYFKNYLAQDGLFTPAESGLIQAMLPNLRDWYIQAGAGGMTATDTENRGAFMLGGSAADTLTGGDVTLRLGSLMLDLGNGDAVHIGSFAFEDGTVLNSNKSRRWRDGDAVADAAYWIALARTVKVGAGGMKCLAAGTARNDWAWRVAA